MKVIMVMFDSLNRRMLEPYGCDWVKTPNFRRLAERAVTFENAYVGSMPCMPARRELHTGRLNFLHRSWGPCEPFDESMPEILKKNGVHSQLISDHYHYWEDGGATYHTRYSGWEFSRGQEGDPWKGEVAEPEFPANALGRHEEPSDEMARQDVVNRKYTQGDQHPQVTTFNWGADYIRRNANADNWFLQLEVFDPHEPYFCNPEFKKDYPYDPKKLHFDWPWYRQVTETPEQAQHLRYENAALHTMCDASLGRVLDLMDEHDLWKDTMLIVNTDHGFLLGEHDWWAKCAMPFYNEIAHTPLFVWDPRCGVAGARRQSLVQTIDLAPTVLEFFGLERPAEMQGAPLGETVANDAPVREAALYGMHGAHVNVTDGRYVYMRAPAGEENAPLANYTLMPTHMRHSFAPEELQNIQLEEPFSFTKGCRTMKIASEAGRINAHEFGTLLFDLEDDPGQERPLDDPEIEVKMIAHLDRLMRENDAPPEQWERLGIEKSE